MERFDLDSWLSHKPQKVEKTYHDDLVAERDQLAVQVASLRATMQSAAETLMDTERRPDDCCIDAHRLLIDTLNGKED